MLRIYSILAVLLLSVTEAAVVNTGYSLIYVASEFNKIPDESWSDEGILNDNACRWRYVTCNSNGDVTQLSLSNLGLGGSLISTIGQISSLEVLYLEGNNFTGTLPAEIGSLPNLKIFDASENNFRGTIPETFGNSPSLTSLKLSHNDFISPIPPSVQSRFCYSSFIENPAVTNLTSIDFPDCQTGGYVALSPPPPPQMKKKSNLGLILGVSIGGSTLFLVFIFLFIFFYFWRRNNGGFKRLSNEDIQNIEAGMSGLDLSRVRRFTLEEIIVATENFSQKKKLGEGGYSEVFKGNFEGSSEFAVKRIKDWRIGRGEVVTFLNEVDLISRAVHRNILKLTGFCIDNGERILVFPLMPNGSVADHLQGYRLEGKKPLSLEKRIKAAIGAAEGLSYLHDSCDTRILHRDVKAANVLLTENFTAVVGDFGLAKLLNEDATHVTTAVQGTFGHIAPEYILNGHVSEKTDVYGFGVFLLEMITGKDALHLSAQPKEDFLLRDWVVDIFEQGCASQLVDLELLMMDMNVINGKYDLQPIKNLLQVSMLCLSEDPRERPTMADCIQLLSGDGFHNTWELWQKGVDDITVDRHDLLNAMDDFQSGTFLSSVSDESAGFSLVGRSVVSGPR